MGAPDLKRLHQPLPTYIKLAEILSQVTQAMLNGPAERVVGAAATPEHFHASVAIPIAEAGGATVAVSTDLPGGVLLASSFYSCSPEVVNEEMIVDVISEIVNMLAGALVSVLGVSVPLVPPSSEDFSNGSEDGAQWLHHTFRCQRANLYVSLLDRRFSSR